VVADVFGTSQVAALNFSQLVVQGVSISSSNLAGGVAGVVIGHASSLKLNGVSVSDVSIKSQGTAGGFIGEFRTSGDPEIINSSITSLSMVVASDSGAIIGTHGGANVVFSHVSVKNSQISSGDNLGALAGSSGNLSASNISIISLSLSVNGKTAGGLAGLISGSAYINNANVLDLSITGPTDVNQAGGLIGFVSGNASINRAAVSNFSKLFDSGTSNSSAVGGLMGLVSGSARITESYVVGTLAGVNPGAFIGSLSNSISSSITSSYFSVTGAAFDVAGVLSGSTWQDRTSNLGASSVSANPARTTAGYPGWNFANVWGFANNSGYQNPLIRALAPCGALSCDLSGLVPSLG
jgi:hypothetical protein